MIAVMGASGNVGGAVSELLLEDGQEVRVFGRSAERLDHLGRRGADVVVGDVGSPEDVQALLEGTAAALVLLPDNVGDPDYVSNRSHMSRVIVTALRDQKVKHVVFLSSIGAEQDGGVGQVGGLHEIEGLLRELPDANTLSLRAAWHMENLLLSLPMVREQHMNGGATRADLPIPMIATADIAERAADHLRSLDFTGHVVETILGPEDVSMADATRALGEALGMPDLPYMEFPPEGVKAALQGAGMSEEFASLLVESQIAINEGRITGGERTTESTTPTRLEEFLARALPG
jgi:uncharacterized protein YbjT (DUF2867 family)